MENNEEYWKQYFKNFIEMLKSRNFGGQAYGNDRQ